jgi:hypothetical protein
MLAKPNMLFGARLLYSQRVLNRTSRARLLAGCLAGMVAEMRFLWPAATLFLLLVVLALVYFDRVRGCDVLESGAHPVFER